MTTSEHPSRLSEADFRTTQRLVDDARRSGVVHSQVLALVRPGAHDDLVLMLGHEEKDDGWTVPVAWVHPTETFVRSLEWLCDEHLGLTDWSASFATVVTYVSPGGAETLQIAFDVTVAPDSALAWSGPCQWWRIGTDPPALHALARPVVRRLQETEPAAAAVAADGGPGDDPAAVTVDAPV